MPLTANKKLSRKQQNKKKAKKKITESNTTNCWQNIKIWEIYQKR